jgi:hypothetical protein
MERPGRRRTKRIDRSVVKVTAGRKVKLLEFDLAPGSRERRPRDRPRRHSSRFPVPLRELEQQRGLSNLPWAGEKLDPNRRRLASRRDRSARHSPKPRRY